LTVRGRLLRIAYQLHYHVWGNWSLARWLAGLPIVAAVVLIFWRLVNEGLVGAGVAFWLPVAVLLLLALAVILWVRWAIAHDYLVFTPQATPAPDRYALQPAAKVLLRATGEFEVEGKAHFFAQLLAYWRTFATREHSVMAIAHKTRYLGIGVLPDLDVGMWYIFWCPEKMVELTPGLLTFGAEQRSGLRVRYDTPEISEFQRRQLPFWQRGRKFSRRKTVYLSFEDEATRQQVWSDLLADGTATGGATAASANSDQAPRSAT
jgi:hypothetical protein